MVSAAALREAGFVESFEGSPDGYAIEREGEIVPVAIFGTLYAGDRVEVRLDGGKIKLRLADRRSLMVTRADSPFLIEDAGEVATVQGNIVRWLGGFLGGQSNHVAGRSLVTRDADDKLRAPLLEPPGPTLVAGLRRLHLAWEGGQAPYQVRIIAVDTAAVVAAVEGIPLAHTQASVQLRPGGAYRVEIHDARGAHLERTLSAVTDGPTPPPDLSGLPPGSSLESTLQGAWLASLSDGEWLLEGYQRIAEIADSYRPAGLLRDALEGGERPPAPTPVSLQSDRNNGAE